MFYVSWRTLECLSVEWTMVKSTSVHSEVKAWIMAGVDRPTVHAV